MAMHSFLAVSALLATLVVLAQGAANPQQVKDKVLAVAKKCAADNKLNQDKMKIAFNQEIPQNEPERCFLECVYTGADVLANGKFNLEGSKKLISARFTGKDVDVGNKLVETCHKEIVPKADEPCSLGKAVRECFVKNGKTVNFFPSAA